MTDVSPFFSSSYTGSVGVSCCCRLAVEELTEEMTTRLLPLSLSFTCWLLPPKLLLEDLGMGLGGCCCCLEEDDEAAVASRLKGAKVEDEEEEVAEVGMGGAGPLVGEDDFCLG